MTDSVNTKIYVLFHASAVAALARRSADAILLGEQVATQASKYGLTMWAAMAPGVTGQGLLESGDATAALGAFTRWRALTDASRAGLLGVLNRSAMAEAMAHRRRRCVCDSGSRRGACNEHGRAFGVSRSAATAGRCSGASFGPTTMPVQRSPSARPSPLRARRTRSSGNSAPPATSPACLSRRAAAPRLMRWSRALRLVHRRLRRS